MVGTWKVLDHIKSVNIAVLSVARPTLLRGLTAHTHHCDIKRVFDLVMVTEVDDATLSFAVVVCSRCIHMVPLSQLLNRLPSLPSNVSAPIFQVMFKSIGRMGDVDSNGADDCPWTAARSFDVRLHGSGPGDVWAARRGSGADPQPCELRGDEALHQPRYLHHRSQSFTHIKRAEEILSANEEMKQWFVGVYTVAFNTILAPVPSAVPCIARRRL